MTDQNEKRRRKAVALRYDLEQDAAPKLLAKGQGLLAEKIIEIAKAHGVHVYEDPGLVAVLSTFDLDTQIPE